MVYEAQYEKKKSLFYTLYGLLCNIHKSNNFFELTALETTGNR
jgi:hypothetical protein